MLDKIFNKINDNNTIKSCQETQKFIMDLIEFGYRTNNDILNDLNDEIEELKYELYTDNKDRIKEEIGDVLFVLCNLANQHNINLEEALQYSTKEYQRRFVYIENKVGSEKFKNLGKSEISKLWKEAKDNK